MLLLRFARCTPVGSLAAGSVVVVEGRVVPRTVLKVLGTNTSCVFHESVIEEWKSGVRGGRAMWTPMRGEQELEPFEIDDGSGRVLVWPDEGNVDIRGGRRERLPARTGQARSVTRYIAPGDVVRVRGLVRIPPAPKKGKPRAALELGAPDGGKLIVLFRAPGADEPMVDKSPAKRPRA